MINKVILGMIVGIGLIASMALNACPVTIKNDTNSPIIIAAHDGSQTVFIPAGGTEKFGNHLQHAYFNVMLQRYSNDYRAACTLIQKFCSPDPLYFTVNQLLSLDESIDRTMFDIKEYIWTPAPHDESAAPEGTPAHDHSHHGH